MNAYWDIPTSDETAFQANLQAIQDRSMKTHGLPLSTEDLEGIEYVYHALLLVRPGDQLQSSIRAARSGRAAYVRRSDDDAGLGERRRAELSRDRGRLCVPEGAAEQEPDRAARRRFRGPKALRAVGAYSGSARGRHRVLCLERRELPRPQHVWPTFCANVATMPLDEVSTFIRPGLGRGNITFSMPSGTNTVAVANATSALGTLQQRMAVVVDAVAAGPAGSGRGSPFGAMADGNGELRREVDLAQPPRFRLCVAEYRNIRVGVLPQREELLVGGAGF